MDLTMQGKNRPMIFSETGNISIPGMWAAWIGTGAILFNTTG